MPGVATGNLIIYMMTNAFTPGPSNFLALNTATKYGFKRGLPTYIGIVLGYLTVETLCGLLVYFTSVYLNKALNVLKYIGAAYIIFLAVHVAISKPPAEDDEMSQKTASGLKGYLLQLINVKIYLYGITVLTGFVTDYTDSLWILLFVELMVVLLGCISMLTWVAVGTFLKKVYLKHFRIINIVCAIALLWCAISLFL